MPVSLFSSVIHQMLLRPLCETMMTKPPLPHPPLPRPVCLHSLLGDVPYPRQNVPPSVSVEVWVQGSDAYGLLYPSFNPSVFCCYDCCIFELHRMLGMITVDVSLTNIPNNIWWTTELKRTGVNLVELNFFISRVSLKGLHMITRPQQMSLLSEPEVYVDSLPLCWGLENCTNTLSCIGIHWCFFISWGASSFAIRQQLYILSTIWCEPFSVRPLRVLHDYTLFYVCKSPNQTSDYKLTGQSCQLRDKGWPLWSSPGVCVHTLYHPWGSWNYDTPFCTNNSIPNNPLCTVNSIPHIKSVLNSTHGSFLISHINCESKSHFHEQQHINP